MNPSSSTKDEIEEVSTVPLSGGGIDTTDSASSQSELSMDIGTTKGTNEHVNVIKNIKGYCKGNDSTFNVILPGDVIDEIEEVSTVPLSGGGIDTTDCPSLQSELSMEIGTTKRTNEHVHVIKNITGDCKGNDSTCNVILPGDVIISAGKKIKTHSVCHNELVEHLNYLVKNKEFKLTLVIKRRTHGATEVLTVCVAISQCQIEEDGGPGTQDAITLMKKICCVKRQLYYTTKTWTQKRLRTPLQTFLKTDGRENLIFDVIDNPKSTKYMFDCTEYVISTDDEYGYLYMCCFKASDMADTYLCAPNGTKVTLKKMPNLSDSESLDDKNNTLVKWDERFCFRTDNDGMSFFESDIHSGRYLSYNIVDELEYKKTKQFPWTQEAAEEGQCAEFQFEML